MESKRGKDILFQGEVKQRQGGRKRNDTFGEWQRGGDVCCKQQGQGWMGDGEGETGQGPGREESITMTLDFIF